MTDVRKLRELDIVQVYWVDASFTAEEVIPETCAISQGTLLETVGFVVYVGKEFLTVAMEYSQETQSYRGACDIPIACIQDIKVLRRS